MPTTSFNFNIFLSVSKLSILPEAEPEVVKVSPATNEPVISTTKKFWKKLNVGAGEVSYLFPCSTVFKPLTFPMPLPNALILPPLPLELVIVKTGVVLYPLPPFDKNKSVISPVPVCVSWTITSPAYLSPSCVNSSKTILSPELSSLAIPPLTTLIKPAAFAPNVPVLLKLITSPIA